MKTACLIVLASLAALAQEAPVVVPAGTRIPLQLINRISTKNAHEGDQVYLTSAYPIVVDSHIVIPPGSYVKGTITQTKRPGRVAGRGELYLRFDSLTLPNGVTRDFRGRVGAIDGSSSDTLDKKEGKVVSDGSKAHDAATIGEIGAAGASIGAIAARSATGAAVGGGAGVVVGLAAVLLTRGPDAALERGSTVDMVLDRELSFRADEVNFSGNTPRPAVPPPSQPPASNSAPLPHSRIPE
jgi:type IV secretion system protein VirB10